MRRDFWHVPWSAMHVLWLQKSIWTHMASSEIFHIFTTTKCHKISNLTWNFVIQYIYIFFKNVIVLFSKDALNWSKVTVYIIFQINPVFFYSSKKIKILGKKVTVSAFWIHETIHHFLTTLNKISKLHTNLCKLQTSRSKSNNLVKNIFSFVRI